MKWVIKLPVETLSKIGIKGNNIAMKNGNRIKESGFIGVLKRRFPGVKVNPVSWSE